MTSCAAITFTASSVVASDLPSFPASSAAKAVAGTTRLAKNMEADKLWRMLELRARRGIAIIWRGVALMGRGGMMGKSCYLLITGTQCRSRLPFPLRCRFPIVAGDVAGGSGSGWPGVAAPALMRCRDAEGRASRRSPAGIAAMLGIPGNRSWKRRPKSFRTGYCRMIGNRHDNPCRCRAAAAVSGMWRQGRWESALFAGMASQAWTDPMGSSPFPADQRRLGAGCRAELPGRTDATVRCKPRAARHGGLGVAGGGRPCQDRP